MDVSSVSPGAAVMGVLADKNAAAVEQAQMGVLRKSMDTTQQTADTLLKMMGVGQNLNVVG